MLPTQWKVCSWMVSQKMSIWRTYDKIAAVGDGCYVSVLVSDRLRIATFRRCAATDDESRLYTDMLSQVIRWHLSGKVSLCNDNFSVVLRMKRLCIELHFFPRRRLLMRCVCDVEKYR